MRPPRFLSAMLLCSMLAFGGCGAGRGAGMDDPPTTVRVVNRGFLDVNVHVLHRTQRVRLGLVSGLSTRVLTIPPHLLFGITSLRFIADPIGTGARPVTHEIQVVPGDEVTLEIMR